MNQDVKAFLSAFLFFLVAFTALYSPTIFTGHLLCTEVQALNSFFCPAGFWTNSVYSGFPWIAQPDAMMFYPPAMFSRLGANNWNWFIVLTFVLSGTFMFAFARLLTGSAFAGLVAGIAFSMSYLPNQISHFSMLHAICWMVGGLLALEYYDRKPTGLTFACGALCATLCGLAGHPQTFASALGLWIFYVAIKTTLKPNSERISYFATMLAMIFLGALVSSMQLFHTAELSTFSAREKFSFADFLTYSAHPLQAIGVFMPFLFGGAPDGIINQPLFGNFLVFCQDFYYGFIILFFSLSTVFALRKERMIFFWALIGLLSFLVSFGNATPLAWLMYHVPPYGGFRALHRMMLVSTIANAVLAAYCVEAIEKKRMPLKPMAIVIAVLTSLFAVLVAEMSAFGDLLVEQAAKNGIPHLGTLPWNNPSIGIPCIMFTLSLVACLAYQRSPQNITRAAILIVLLADLGFTSWYSFGAAWRIDAPPVSILTEPFSGQKYQKLADAHHNRLLTIRGGSASYDELKTNLDQIWNVPNASGYGPLMLSRYGELLNMTEGGFLIPPFHYQPEDRCFDILSIKYATAFTGDNRLEDIGGPSQSPWRKVDEIGTASIHENVRVMPRCWLTHHVKVLPAEQILSAIKTSRLDAGAPFDPSETALLEALPAQLPADLSSEIMRETKAATILDKPQTETAAIEMLTNSDTRITTDTPSPSFLVISDIFLSWLDS